jgi:hypothetical protein
MCCKDIYISLNRAVIFSMATDEATGNVQRNRIVKSKQGRARLRFSGPLKVRSWGLQKLMMSKKDVLLKYWITATVNW